MRIAYLTNMATSLSKGGGFAHVTQVAHKLLHQGHTLYTNLPDESESFIRLSEEEFFIRGNEIDAFYIRLHGSAHNDELTRFRKANPAAPCVWEINAPIEELKTGGTSDVEIKRKSERRKELAQNVDAAVCVSIEMEEYARNILEIKKTFIVLNGTDPDMFTPEKRQSGLYDKSDFTVIWAGSPQYPWQGLDIIEKLAARLKELDKSIVVAVTAEGSSRDNILYLGRVLYSEIPQYIASADAGLCIYKSIDFYSKFYFSPLKLYDYMASGLPVIGSDTGQIKLLLEKYGNGILTDNTIDDIAKKIAYLKRNRTVAVEMGKMGREFACKYHSWDGTVSQIEKILYQLILERLKNSLEEKENLIHKYRHSSGDKISGPINDRNKSIEDLKENHETIIMEMKRNITQKDVFISNILNSKSWKITSPLRKISKKLKGK